MTPSDGTYERSVYKKARESKRSAVAKPERDIRCVIRDPLAGIKSLRESLRGRGAGARTFSLLRAAFALACEKRHARRFFGFPSRGAPPLVAASASSRGTHGGMDRERGRRLRDALPRRGRLRSGRGMARVAGVQRGARGDDSRVRFSSFARINQNRSRRRLGRGLLFVVPNARCATLARLTRLFSSVLYSSTENDAG